MSIANAMSIEVEHQLRFGPKVVRYVDGHTVSTHTTDHGFCTCSWEMWSRHGRDEIYPMHRQHQEFERQKQQEAKENLGELEASKHSLELNVLGDAATCSACDWFLASSKGIAYLMVQHSYHRDHIKRGCTENAARQ